jgi:hypothetical protein
MLLLVQLAIAALPRGAIDALVSRVEPAFKDKCKAALQGEAFTFSQAWQDWYVFHNHFANRLEWGAGTYMDIGTSPPPRIEPVSRIT